MSEYSYLEIVLTLKHQPEEIESAYIIGAIDHSLKQVFGEIGGSSNIELLSLTDNKNIILKVLKEDTKKIRVALTLLHTFKDIPCRFLTQRISNIPIDTLL
uniref:CSON002256 protein n=1 Tax=Culicoides sonorensis TaxID=179676 RepID=A0A336LVL0_CULSO